MSNYVPEAANNAFRTTGVFYRSLITRPTEKVKRYTIAATTTAQVATKGNPHTLTVKNVGNADVRFAHSAADAESTTEFLTLNVGETRKFDYHISGYEVLVVGGSQIQKAIFHCEWADNMFVRNPAAIDAIVEVLVVG